MKSTVETDYVLKGADVFTQADIDANYVLKTCGSPPAGKQFKACTGPGSTCTGENTVCGDPTGQTDCATKCFEDFVGKQDGEECSEAADCASGLCKEPFGGPKACISEELYCRLTGGYAPECP